MKISRPWLQRYFEKELPDAATLAEALTFHAFEIESVENDTLDVKVTANRGHDCLCHRGIAKELSAILELSMKSDPLRDEVTLEPKTDAFVVTVENAELCPRFSGALITGVKVGPSPEWLRAFLGSLGQKSINNIVDATNFVMFDLGQPLHAFDVGKLTEKNGGHALTVRLAKSGEKLMGLDDKEYALAPSMIVIADGNTNEPVSIAGIKGGKPTGIDEKTAAVFLEAANWNGVAIRKTSQALKLRTDASARFEQDLSSEVCAHGIRAAADLIHELAGGEVVSFVDEYPHRQERTVVCVDTARINAILGADFSTDAIADVFARLDLPFTVSRDEFVIEPPLERLDLRIPEDIAEEVGRILGYDKIQASALPRLRETPEVNKNFYAAEHVREDLLSKAYSEVVTSVFADTGERVVANKVDGVRPFLRTTLVNGLADALQRNWHNQNLLGLSEVKLFEIGTVWKGGKEMTMLGTADDKGAREELLELSRGRSAATYENLPLTKTQQYQPFSKYPFIVRDVAMWVSAGTKSESIMDIIKKNAGALLVRSELFDTFKKGEKVSLAFRLVFQSFDKTLTDQDANERMASISTMLKAEGFEVR